ncbi:MAG: hypothetical protein SH820_04750 [Xanthomonadales bacterium]|nr:hypothetical protein [Xanthomonadales bacterium]
MALRDARQDAKGLQLAFSDGSLEGYQVSRLTHSLQSATRAEALTHFEPMLREVFSRAPNDPRVLKEPTRLE